MGYYTIWLAFVKTILCFILGILCVCLENVSGPTIGIFGEAMGGST